VNSKGAPAAAAYLTSALGAAVIVGFALAGLDPVLNLFFWFSGVAVVAIVLIEILVCISVVVFFAKNGGDEGVFVTRIAPVLAAIGLVLGDYLLMSRFGLLAGTVADGVDPTTTAWGLSPVGWFLVLLPFVIFAAGLLFAGTQKRDAALIQDVLA
jgi:hypothetical protein